MICQLYRRVLDDRTFVKTAEKKEYISWDIKMTFRMPIYAPKSAIVFINIGDDV